MKTRQTLFLSMIVICASWTAPAFSYSTTNFQISHEISGTADAGKSVTHQDCNITGDIHNLAVSLKGQTEILKQQIPNDLDKTLPFIYLCNTSEIPESET